MTGARRPKRSTREQVRAVALSAVMILSVVAGVPLGTGVAAAQDGSSVPEVDASEGSVEFDADAGAAVRVDPDLNVSDPGGSTQLDGARVAITENRGAGDELAYNDTTAGDAGISGAYDSSAGVLTFTGNAAVAEYEAVLRTVNFTNDRIDPETANRTIEFRLGANYSAATGHYYEYVADDSGITWTEARGEANSSTYLGQRGYLATITSSAENNHVYDRWSGDADVWIGGTDSGTEGEWHWVTGPEGNETAGDHLAGVPFWSGAADGGPVDDAFENWAAEQPNDYEGQDYAGFFSDESNSWQDFALAGDGEPSIGGYVIEYGGRSGDPDVQIADTKTVTVNSSSSLPVSESFEESTADIDDWRFDGDAVSGVVEGDGNREESVLRLTEAAGNQAGTGLYTNPFSSNLGITAEFSYYANEGDGADGVSFFLLNASQVDPLDFRTGASGGSLGYSGDPGISAGYLGVGFDEYGNFASDTEAGHGDGPGRTDQSVTIRGAGDRASSGDDPWYPHLVTAEPTKNIDGGWRDVVLTIDPAAGGEDDIGIELQMSWDGGDTWETVVDDTYTRSKIGSDMPESFYMGFSGSTGGSTNVHAIGEVDVQVPADLETTVTAQPTGSFDRLEYVEYEYEVTNNGPNNATDVSLDNSLPTGAEGLTGVEWEYETTDGQTDSGRSIDLSSATVDLDSGETVTVTVSGTVGRQAAGNLDHTVGASNTGIYSDPTPSDSSASVSIDVVEQPTGLQTGAGAAAFVERGGAVVVDSNLTVTDGTQDVSGATVTIVDGYDADADELGYDETVADNRGIDGTADGDSLSFADAGGQTPTADDYQAVLRTVTYNNTAAAPAEVDREIAFRLSAGGGDVLYNPDTGRYYEHVSDESIAWADARDAAEGRSHFGMSGYLATITSEGENDFLREQFDEGGWIGASDAADESEWRWVTGPEGLEEAGDGRHFFTQTGGHVAGFGPYAGAKRGNVGGGDPVDGAYENWNPRHEPNNKFPQFGGQDYAYLCAGPGSCADGMWMDAADSSPPFDADGYFVEYGGLPADPVATPGDARTVTITRNSPPTADAGNNVTAEVDATIEFDASNSSDVIGIDDYRWDFGDGTVYDFDSNNETVTYAYAGDGNYTVTLTVRDTTGQTATDEIGVTVQGETVLVANAGANETVDEGDTVEFNASASEASEGFADTGAFQWDFGDGESDTGETVTHTYDDPGTYRANLTITDTAGNAANATKYVVVEDVTPPTADAGDDVTVAEGGTVDLDGSGSTDAFSSVETYEWDTTGNGDINATGETTSVTYAAAGNYTVTLYATDEAGNTGTDTVNVTVTDATDPVADAGEDVSATVGQRITFDGTNSTDNVGIDTVEWDFGDGNTTAGASAAHNYSAVGTYTVEVNVTDFDGNSDTDTLTATVTDPPEVTATGGQTDFVQYRGPVVVDGGIEISYDGYFEGAEVSIEDGFDPDSDVLAVPAGDVPENITGVEYDAATGVLSLSGNGTAADYQAALRNVTYNNTAAEPDETDREITFSVGNDSRYNPETGRYYEFVEDDGITWFDARDAAAERDHFGLPGYLATVTESAENDFIADKLAGQGWIGASDSGDEGEWHWVTGPEGEETDGDLRGVHFFAQTASVDGEPASVYGGATPGGGDAVDGNYTNWARGEPNEWGSGEDFAHYWARGTWNDYASDNGNIDGYIVEYGGFEDDPDVQLTDNRTVTVAADRAPAAVAFGANSTTVADAVNFTAANSSDDRGVYGYAWDFGDGTAYGVDPGNETVSHSYAADGNYTVTLTVEDTANQTSTAELDVTVVDDTFVIANPGANQSIDEGQTVTLNASGSRASEGFAAPDTDAFQWDVDGDGAFEKFGEEVTHTYDEHGTKAVTLNVTDSRGNSSTATTYVHVADVSPPSAVAGANVTITDGNLSVDEGDAVEFNASGSSKNGTDLAGYEWSFPDFSEDDQAAEQSGETVTYRFSPGEQNGPGNYTVTLTVTDEAGNENSTTLTVTVNDVTPPSADAGSDIVAERGEPFAFDGTGSTDNAELDTYVWDVPRLSENLTGATPTHTFDRVGRYNVTLTANDTSGHEDTDHVLVLVEDTVEPDVQEFSLSNPEGQSVGVTVTTDEPLAELSVALDGPEDATLSGGAFETSETAGTYTYTATYGGSSNGEYEATLETAADEEGNDGGTGQQRTLAVAAPPVIEADDVAISNPDGRTLDVSIDSDQELSAIELNLTRDGSHVTTLTAADFEVSEAGGVYTYTASYEAAEDGAFEATLETAENVNGDDGADGQSDSVALDEDLVADVTAGSALVSLGSEVAFDADRASIPAGETPTYEWRVDGTLESQSANFTHTFEETGEHTVEVTIEAGGAIDTDAVTITVEDREPPDVRLAVNDTTPSVNDTVHFDATGSTDNDAIDGYDWDLTGDGTLVDQGDGERNFTYEKPGTFRETVTVTDPSGNENDRTVKIVVQGPNASVDRTEIDFGDTTRNSTNVTSITVSNDGTTPLNVTNVSFGDPGEPFSVVGDAATSLPVVQPGSSRSIAVAFEPTAATTNQTTLTIEHNATHVANFTVDLLGTGIESDLSVDDSSQGFGSVSVGQSGTRTVGLTNEGSDAADVTDVTIAGETLDAFEVTDGGGLPGELGSGDTASVDVAFEPVRSGEQTATLRVTTADGTVTTISLNGTGTGPEIALPDGDVDFGEVGTGNESTETVRIANYGTEPLDVASVTVTGADRSAFAVEGVPDTVAAGATESVDVTFAPSDAGNHTAVFAVDSDDPTVGTVERDLNGSAVAPSIDANPRNVDFGNVTVGETVSFNVTVRNLHSSKSNLSVRSTQITGKDPGDFEVSDGSDAPFSLEPGDSKKIQVNFTPSSQGTKEAQLQILSNAGNEPQIDVWLSNTRTYVVVQEVAADADRDSSAVNLDANNVESGTTFSINVSKPGTRDRNASIDTIRMTTDHDGDFQMNITHQDDPVNHTLDETDRESVQYIEQNYSVDSSVFDGTAFDYRVRKDQLPSGVDPEDVVFYRYNTTRDAWVAHDSTLERTSDSNYLFSVDTPGFSELAVSVPAADDTDGSGGSDSGSSDALSTTPEDGTVTGTPEDGTVTAEPGTAEPNTDTGGGGGSGPDAPPSGEDSVSTDGGSAPAEGGDGLGAGLGLPQLPPLAWGIGGLSLFAGLMSLLFLLGRQRVGPHRIAVVSDVDDRWTRLAASAVARERDRRELTDTVTVTEIETGRRDRSVDGWLSNAVARVSGPSETTRTSLDSVDVETYDTVLAIGASPAAFDGADDIRLVRWALPDVGAGGESDARRAHELLASNASALFEDRDGLTRADERVDSATPHGGPADAEAASGEDD
ncbi:PKD domain-containing protein [Halobellus sp. GM3]|uniref:PKD domain-containing protein n=1 Tax=Halobellus sp. GM3 TaxID=3458410 RepID=UPI00403E0AAA